MSKKPILEIQNLSISFASRHQSLKAIDNISFSIDEGEIVGVVGESGSGKSVMSQSILRLLEYDSNVKYDGKILFNSKNIFEFNKSELRDLRGNEISMIFQNPLTSLSPVHTIGKQLSEVLIIHKHLSKKEALEQSKELLGHTNIPSPEEILKKYPYELSGGMLQRVMIAIALGCEPKLLIADEPTTALDVTIQEQILQLIKKLNKEKNMSVLFITHDMGVVSQLCDSVKVMYLGQIVEEAKTKDLFNNPLHPYTKGLLKCMPSLISDKHKVLSTISGTVPSLSNIPIGCNFCTRCSEIIGDECTNSKPDTYFVNSNHSAKCWRFKN